MATTFGEEAFDDAGQLQVRQRQPAASSPPSAPTSRRTTPPADAEVAGVRTVRVSVFELDKPAIAHQSFCLVVRDEPMFEVAHNPQPLTV